MTDAEAALLVQPTQQAVWVGFAVHKESLKSICIKKTWVSPPAQNVNRYMGGLVYRSADCVIYEAGCWAHTEGTPKIHPNEQEWYFVLVRR